MNTKDHPLSHLFENNDAWVKRKLANDPQFFERLKDQQAPEYLWIGCSDSRVPANQIIGLPPGEVFVHRNIANVVVHTDLNCLSVLQFAVDLLQVKHIMVVGHYGCSGVNTALTNHRVGLADNWLHHVQDVRDKHAKLLDQWPLGEVRYRRLIELNAIEQVVNVCRTTIVNDAWTRGQPLTVYGLVYGVHDGRMRNLDMAVSAADELTRVHQRCVEALSTERASSNYENDMVAADAAQLADVAEQAATRLQETEHGHCCINRV
ncbi:MAG: carbonate dehydratase [Burkholderia sp.]